MVFPLLSPYWCRFVLCFLLLLGGGYQARAQAPEYRILDEKGQPVEYATVRIRRAGAESDVKTVLTNEQGAFILAGVAPGNYQIIVLALGWQPDTSAVELPRMQALTVRLRPASRELQEVVVRGTLPLVEKRADRLIFRVNRSIAAESSSLWEMLRKTPLVRADEQAGVSIRNTPGVSVYVNDRRIYLSGDDLTQYLQSIRASDVDRIEVITTPPARYDAEGGSGVLNIVLKSDPTTGLNGAVQSTYSQTTTAKFNPSATLNFRTAKINLYANGAYGFGRYYRREDYLQQYVSTQYRERLYARSGQDNTHLLAGVDFSPSSTQTLGIVVQNSTQARDGNNENYGQFGPQGLADSLVVNRSTQRQRSSTQTINANYQLALDTTGRLLTLDADLVRFNAPVSVALNRNIVTQPNNAHSRAIAFANAVDRAILIRALKVDYVHPFRNGTTWESGVKFVNSQATNQFTFENLGNAQQLQDSAGSAVFSYRETVAAAYSSYHQSWKKWDFQFGLRGEWTHALGTAAGRNLLERRYLKVFPTAYLQYSYSEGLQLNLNYSRRLQRPDFSAVNPFRNYVTPYAYYAGNPLLQPAFTHAIEASLLLRNKYNFSFFAKFTEGQQTQLPVQDQQTNRYQMRYVNVDRSKLFGADASVSAQPFLFWEANCTLSGQYATSQMVVPLRFALQGFFWNVISSNSFVLHPSSALKAEINLSFISAGNLQGALRLGQQTTLDVGLSRPVMHRRGLFSLTGTDLLNSAYLPARVAFGDQQSLTTGFLDQRGVRLSFRYQYGKKTVKSVRDRQTSTSTEKDRL